MSADLDHLFAALEAHPTWRVVLLRPNGKKPLADQRGHWQVTQDRDAIAAYIASGGNVGLRAGVRENLAIFDVDDLVAYAELWDHLGPLGDATVITASGKQHVYTQWAPGIPSKLVTPDGVVVGEPRRGEMTVTQVDHNQQMAVCPPSQVDGRSYRFVDGIDLAQPLPEIPPRWVDYFRQTSVRPSAMPRLIDVTDFEDRFAAALAQPGARLRLGGAEVKFQCPRCCELGRDTSMDNARLFQNGSWGCAVYPKGTPGSLEHWEAIGIVLGVLQESLR